MPSKDNATSLPALERLNRRNLRLRDLDRLDRRAIGAMALLAIGFGYLAVTLDTTPFRQNSAIPAAVQAQAISPEYTAKIKIAGQLLVAGNMEKLKSLLDELIAANSYQAEPFMILGDYFLRMQEPVPAMHAYRQGLDLNLEYLEKKSPLYQGKKIKNIVREAEGRIQAALAVNPGDQEMRKNRDEVYYMLRKLAGGCGD